MPHYVLINSDKEEAIRYFKQLKAERDDVQLSVITRHRYASLYESFADEIYGVDDVGDITQASQLMLALSRNRSVQAIITPTEKSILTGGFLRSYFALSGPQLETTLWLTNKLAMNTRLKAAGIPIADFMRLDRKEDILQAAQYWGWPIVVKPAAGTGRKGMKLIRSEQDYDHWQANHLLDDIGYQVPWLAERFITMEEYHCDALIQQGQLGFTSVSKYFEPLHQVHGESEGSYIIHEQGMLYSRMVELVQSIADAMKVKEGPLHMEIFHTTSGELLVGEVALRVGGGGISRSILHKYGVSMWDASFQIAMQQEAVIDESHQEGIYGWVSIPCQDGILHDYTSAEELKRIAEIVDVEYHYQQGDRVYAKKGCDYELATIYFRIEQESQLAEVIERIRDSFKVYYR